jgi:Family of unknown function (DUF5906)
MNEEQDLPISWSSNEVYFYGAKSTFQVDAGSYFRTISKRSTVVSGITRRYMQQGIDQKEAKETASHEVEQREIDGHVEWVGEIAGHKKGVIYSINGKPLLITSSPSLPIPKAGPCPTIIGIIRDAFPDDHQRYIFMGWMKGGYMAVKNGVHQPAPLLALAGHAGDGKSLVSYIVKMMLGGRSANPMTAWSKTLPWNDHLVGAELLLLDDCQGSTDHRTRMEFSSHFKSSIYGESVEMNKRNQSSISIRPVWRVMICTNDNPENLLVLPPINTDNADKITLLKISKVNLEIDTSTPQGKTQLQNEIIGELGAFANILEAFPIPDHLKDSRSGTKAWQHPELLEKIESTKPETKLAELFMSSFSNRSDLWSDLPRTLTATEVESRLSEGATKAQAGKLFSYPTACGNYLAKLATSDCEFVQKADRDLHLKVNRYHISKP